MALRVVAQGGDTRVAAVHLDGGAHRAGLSAGDVVVALNGLRVNHTSLMERISRVAPGETVELHAFRRDELMVFSAVAQPPREEVAELVLLEDLEPAVALRRKAWLGA